MRGLQVLGKLEHFDEQLSVNKNEACAFCHMPYSGFTRPIPSLNRTTVAYPGSFHCRFEAAILHLFTALSGASVQRHSGQFLRRQLL